MTFRLSASKLKRYLQCPRTYFLRYVHAMEADLLRQARRRIATLEADRYEIV